MPKNPLEVLGVIRTSVNQAVPAMDMARTHASSDVHAQALMDLDRSLTANNDLMKSIESASDMARRSTQHSDMAARLTVALPKIDLNLPDQPAVHVPIAGQNGNPEAFAKPDVQLDGIEDLGRMVRHSREQRKLSQQELADLAGVGRRFLSELENGKPTLEFAKVLQVARAAGITLIARDRSL